MSGTYKGSKNSKSRGSYSKSGSSKSRSSYSKSGSGSSKNRSSYASPYKRRGRSSRSRAKARAYRKKRRRRIRKLLYTYSPLIGLCAAVVVVIVLMAALIVPGIRQKPHMSLIGRSTVTTAQGEPYVDEGVKVRMRRKDVSDRVYVDDGVDTSVLGTYEYTYLVDGRWKTFSVSRKVNVEDESGPEITLNGDDFVLVDNIADYVEQGATAFDVGENADIDDITVDIEQENDYTWFVTYTAYDDLGNEGTVVREVQLRDYVAPEIALNGDETMTVDQYTDFVDPGARATDNRDGDISGSVTSSGNVDVYRAGTYTVSYSVTDSSGNETTVYRTVNVESVPEPEDHTIYLTFDDGPSESITPQILDILDENNIKATFFILDYTDDELPIIERMIEEGHTVGIHGYSHVYEQIYSSVDAFLTDLYKITDKLEEDTGYYPFVMRFPGGSGNYISASYCEGIMTELVQVVTDEGWMYMDWNSSAEDAAGGTVPVEEIYDNVISTLYPDRRNVVLMHDYSEMQTTADALQSIIDYGNENGYTFLPITESTIPVHQSLTN